MSRFKRYLALWTAGAIMVVGLVAGLAGSAAAASFGFTHQTVLMAGKNNGNGKGNPGGPTPQTPYAILFPLAIGGIAAVMYRRRKRQDPTE